MKIRELLSDESKWTKGANARDSDKQDVSAVSQHAVCWCILGAVQRCYAMHDGMFLTVRKMIQKELGLCDVTDWVDWNDAPERTFKEVKELVDRLDV